MTFSVKRFTNNLILMLLLLSTTTLFGQVDKVVIINDDNGSKVQVNGNDFMIMGMNWDYFPIGTNYSYSLWTKSDETIKAAIDGEMPLLKNLGVNVVRQYSGIPPKWVKYIYEEYGIFTILNHSFGRYGVNMDGGYIANTDYADPAQQKVILDEVRTLVKQFEGVPGVLMWLLGNENNYGLFWGGAETEDIPVGETLESVRARHMYKLFNRGIKEIKKIDNHRPVAICNGDVLFIDIIAEEVKEMDVFGTNMYRGVTFTDAFEQVKNKLNVPLLFTEFGADAYNVLSNGEDQLMQAKYFVGNWKDIYEQSYGNGKIGNSIGGMAFQFSDGWWKYLQDENLSVHDNNASWSNGGYAEDFKEGVNNMNEEWFGICAKGPTDSRGLYQLYPRAAYYATKDIFKINPYSKGMTAEKINFLFSKMNLMEYVLMARGDQSALAAKQGGAIRLSGLRMEFETYNTGGDMISTPDDKIDGNTGYPSFKGFDHMQSFYADFEAQSENVRGTLSLNVLGNVPENPIDEIFYENRGRSRTVLTENGEVGMADIERLRVYNASIDWNHEWFKLKGFYRTGHYHWGYEGDFFGLYPESNYGPNLDTYNGSAPLGFEWHGKKDLDGLKIAFGPELWWGANPAILIKYSRTVGLFDITGIFHEDLDEQSEAISSFAVPVPATRRASLHIATKYGRFGFDVGAIWSGSTKVDDIFQIDPGSEGNGVILQDKIKPEDAFGGKVKITADFGPLKWYGEGSLRGLVADGGINQTQTYTGWRLKESGLGNVYSVLSGFTYMIGDLQIAPNFLWQKPIEGPIENSVAAPGRPRNILSDPFAVLGNRETTAAELLLTYDPTPASWMYAWNSDIQEDAKFAISAGAVVRRHHTTRDASIGILKDGRTFFAFPGAPPARDLWEFHTRIVSKLNPTLGLIVNLYGGEGEPNGDSDRLIHRYGGDIRFVYKWFKIMGEAKVNDWGPYDYHRDFNLTYPLQFAADISTQLSLPNWFDVPSTRLGVRGAWRSLDQYSPRYCPVKTMNAAGVMECDPDAPGYDDGNEWEIRTYLHFNIGM